ncbi:lipocalin [Mesobaculum littorinae]|uniref:Lipocalin n=1 Tax=Mesobaculum littorinae TaxID=2486419 RepID=A0A438AJJ3_9RHOB|nr:lipocalin family protein [Mesobaculum littorinae]RVV98824.1 lipocalin [Mesobaculum littorinae]
MRGSVFALLLCALAACGRDPAPAPEADRSYRDTSVIISSSSRFDAARFAGTWQRQATFGAAYADPPCREVRFVDVPGGMEVETCRGAAPKLYSQSSYGRLQAPGAEPLWVLWVDDDFRTAVVGTPSGRLGWILDRGSLPPDRARAAREVLAFNGYDLSQLRPVAP